MTGSSASASDAGYHRRHFARSQQRAQCIADHIEGPATILDVGCNYGVTSRYLLESGKADRVTGVELYAQTVAADLLQDPRFTLVEGDIAEVLPHGQFDYVVYGAVHHHILHFHGLTAAISTLQKLASTCSRSLFLETGHITEGGRWAWQNSLRKYFRTDEEHLFYLLRSIEHLVDEFSIIGRFWMHGIRRSYLMIDLKSPGKKGDIAQEVAPSDAEGPWVRSFGSRDQTLALADDSENDDSPTLFWTHTAEDGTDLFCKQHRHHPIAASIEYFIGTQVPFEWAIRPIKSTSRSNTVTFRYLEQARKARDLRAAPAAVRRELANQVLRCFADAGTFQPEQADGMLLPKRIGASLLDLCDFNPNNCLVVEDSGINKLYFVDFEQQSTHYLGHNRLNLARILWSLRQRRVRAAFEFMLGCCALLGWLLRFQTLPLQSRIQVRQPSLLSLATAETRSRIGAVLRFALWPFNRDRANP